jgi:hypothetical protein
MKTILPYTHIKIHISDPWDLGESLNWEPLEGSLIAISDFPLGGMALIKLNKSFNYKSTECEYFIATPRYTGANIKTLVKEGSMICGITRIPKELAESQNPFDLSLWRGGVAILGKLELIKR